MFVPLNCYMVHWELGNLKLVHTATIYMIFYVSIEKEWKSLTEEAHISIEADVGSIKDFSQFLQDKIELEGHICSTEPVNLNVFLNNVVCKKHFSQF